MSRRTEETEIAEAGDVSTVFGGLDIGIVVAHVVGAGNVCGGCSCVRRQRALIKLLLAGVERLLRLRHQRNKDGNEKRGTQTLRYLREIGEVRLNAAKDPMHRHVLVHWKW